MRKMIVIGNLTADVVVRTVKTSRGEQHVANFSVADNDLINGVKTTVYTNVTAWGALADAVSKYVHKGSKVYVEGDPRVNLYQGKDGLAHACDEITARNIQFLDSAPRQGSGNGIAAPVAAPAGKQQAPASEPAPAQNDGFTQVEDSVLPF